MQFFLKLNLSRVLGLHLLGSLRIKLNLYRLEYILYFQYYLQNSTTKKKDKKNKIKTNSIWLGQNQHFQNGQNKVLLVQKNNATN